MTVRERILAIKLLEKQEHTLEYAKQIGIQASMVKMDSNSNTSNDKGGNLYG